MRYSKPVGYRTPSVIGTKRYYKLYNDYVSGSMSYSPAAKTPQIVDLTFNAAPANGSQLTFPAGPTNSPTTPTATLTFQYGGSPGSGIVVLPAGGGTTAQGATALAAIINAQISLSWTAVVLVPGVVRATSRVPGVNVSPASIGVTNITMVRTLSSMTATLPGKSGQGACFLPEST